MSARFKVAVLNEQPMMMAGVILALERAPALNVVAQLSSIEAAVTSARDQHPDLMLLGLDDRNQTVAAAETISTRFPDMKLIVMTDDALTPPCPICDGSEPVAHLRMGATADELVRAALAALQPAHDAFAHGIYPDAL